MDPVRRIQDKFSGTGSPTRIPLQRGRTMTARIVDGGISVDNLGTQPFLPWEVFRETLRVIERNGGRARRGNAMNARLGEEGLPLDSIEGHIAHVVYGRRVGESVFRRITPIAAALVWAGICRAGRGELILASEEAEPSRPDGQEERDESAPSRLAALAVSELRARLCGFRRSYADHWELWLHTRPHMKTRVLGQILRKWQACRPRQMRRPRDEADHAPPYLGDLIADAGPHLDAASHLTVADFADVREISVAAMRALWGIFERLPVDESAGCTGITKAVLLLTNGRIGPAFDRVVRTALGVQPFRTADAWLGQLREVALDIAAFEERCRCTLEQAAPPQFRHIEPGRLYDMAFGPREH